MSCQTLSWFLTPSLASIFTALTIPYCVAIMLVLPKFNPIKADTCLMRSISSYPDIFPTISTIMSPQNYWKKYTWVSLSLITACFTFMALSSHINVSCMNKWIGEWKQLWNLTTFLIWFYRHSESYRIPLNGLTHLRCVQPCTRTREIFANSGTFIKKEFQWFYILQLIISFYPSEDTFQALLNYSWQIKNHI
jgi:hypothetical protein